MKRGLRPTSLLTRRLCDVSKGWWNYDITEDNTRQVANLAKGSRITCTGTIKSYVRLFSTTILVDDAAIE